MARRAAEEKARREEELRKQEEEKRLTYEEQQRQAEEERIRREQEEQEKLAELQQQVCGSNCVPARSCCCGFKRVVFDFSFTEWFWQISVRPDVRLSSSCLRRIWDCL